MERAIALDAAGGYATTSSRIHKTVMETFMVYKTGQMRLGITHVLSGGFTLALGVVFMWLTANSLWATLVLAAGTLFGITGTVNIALRDQRPKYVLSAPLLFNSFSLVMSLLQMAFGIYAMVITDISRLYPMYREDNTTNILQILHSLLLFGAAIEMGACVISLKIVGGFACQTWYRKRQRVYTIPYDEDEAEEADGETRGPDIIPDIHQRPMLRIDWTDQAPGLI